MIEEPSDRDQVIEEPSEHVQFTKTEVHMRRLAVVFDSGGPKRFRHMKSPLLLCTNLLKALCASFAKREFVFYKPAFKILTTQVNMVCVIWLQNTACDPLGLLLKLDFLHFLG